MIVIEETRFGTIEVDEASVLTFPNGLVGFPEQTAFVLLERANGKMVAYLQSLVTPALAFPVVDAADFASYPEPSVEKLAASAGLEGNELALLVIVAARPETKTLEANLLAPIIVEMGSRKCAQVVLDARKYSAAHSLAPAADPVAQARARIASIQQKRSQRPGAAM